MTIPFVSTDDIGGDYLPPDTVVTLFWEAAQSAWFLYARGELRRCDKAFVDAYLSSSEMPDDDVLSDRAIDGHLYYLQVINNRLEPVSAIVAGSPDKTAASGYISHYGGKPAN